MVLLPSQRLDSLLSCSDHCLFCLDFVANPHCHFFLRLQSVLLSVSLLRKTNKVSQRNNCTACEKQKYVLHIKLSGVKYTVFCDTYFHTELTRFSTHFQLISEFVVLRIGLIRFTSYWLSTYYVQGTAQSRLKLLSI